MRSGPSLDGWDREVENPVIGVKGRRIIRPAAAVATVRVQVSAMYHRRLVRARLMRPAEVSGALCPGVPLRVEPGCGRDGRHTRARAISAVPLMSAIASAILPPVVALRVVSTSCPLWSIATSAATGRSSVIRWSQIDRG